MSLNENNQKAKFSAVRSRDGVTFFVRAIGSGQVPQDIAAALDGWTRVDVGATYRSPVCRDANDVQRYRRPLAQFRSRLVTA